MHTHCAHRDFILRVFISLHPHSLALEWHCYHVIMFYLPWTSLSPQNKDYCFAHLWYEAEDDFPTIIKHEVSME